MFYYFILEFVIFMREFINLIIVIEGVNSSCVFFIWVFFFGKGEKLESVIIERERFGENSWIIIVMRFSVNDLLSIVGNVFRIDYGVRFFVILVLKKVERIDDYMYILNVFYFNNIC